MWLVTDEETKYEPSPKLSAALDKNRNAQERAKEALKELRAAVADELKTYDITNGQIAEYLPWGEETVRGIAREYDVPPKRKPTVRSIKPQKRTPRTPPST